MSIALRGARYRYAGASRWALDGVDLEFRRGEVVGVVGAGEAGKSTLGLVAAGLAPAVIHGRLEGSVTIDGSATSQLAPHELATRCAILFQDPRGQLSGTARTVWEEVAFGPRNLGLALADIAARVEQCLATVGIEALAARAPARLSGGQAQLVALASVLAMGTPYLVLDEPTAQLDPEGTRAVGEALGRLAASGEVGLLIVEQKTDLLLREADRVAVVGGGRIVLEGPAADVLADERLPGWGVEPPAPVRLRRRLVQAGVDEAIVARAMHAAGGAAGAA